MVFVSIGMRLRVEAEALNMVEALGGYVRHRTVSVLKKYSGDGRTSYKILTVPAISGQSVAYGYHKAIVELAKLMNLNVCDECIRYEKIGGFTKRTTVQGKTHDDRVKECVVEDLTGFMAPEAQVRRTSPVSFSYLVPDVESSGVALDSQFHVRYNLETMEHAIFTIESGTAVFMLSVAIDVDRIGKLTSSYVNDRLARVELAFKALNVLIEGFTYGAKKSRYLPINEVLGCIASISHPIPFMVSPPRVYKNGVNYIVDTINRARKYVQSLRSSNIDEKIQIVYMDRENIVKEPLSGADNVSGISITRTSTFSELVDETLKIVKMYLK